MNSEISKIKWQSLVSTWNIANPPATPSRDDIMIYQRTIVSATKNIPSNTAMLLGCTPSLRLLMANMKIAVTCVDLNQDMLKSTINMLGDVTCNESYVCQDWLEMSLNGSRFPIVIGDKIFDNVSYESWWKLKRNILSHLLPGGSLIIRIAPQDKMLLGRTFSELLSIWAELYKTKPNSLSKAASGLWEQALGASAKTVPGKQSIRFFISEIDSLIERLDQLTDYEQSVFIEFLRLFQMSIGYEWTSYTFGNIIDMLGEELKLTSIGYSNDYEVADRQPILQFIRR